MNVDDLFIQQIVAVVGIAIWFVFPIGMFISIISQDRDAMPARKIPRPEEFEYFHSYPHYTEDPFASVKLGTEKEFEEPKIEDVGQHHINIDPGPDHEHVNI